MAGVNTALRECVPLVSVEVRRKAVPPVTDTGAPGAVVPSLNWTVPAAAGGATFAMRSTGMPRNAGFGVTVRVVVVALPGALTV